MLCKYFLQLGILTSFIFLSTLIFAEGDSDYLFKDFNFLSEEEEKPSEEEETSKEFINASFDDLYNIFSNYSTLSRIQKDESWSKYEGKYIRWKGIVSYKGLGKGDKKRVGIRHKVGTNIELMFDGNKRKLIKMIDKGDRVTYTGKLSKLIGRNLLLGLVDVNIEEINDDPVEELKGGGGDRNASLQASTIASDRLNSLKNEIKLRDEDLSKNSESEEISKERTKASFNELNKVFGKKSSLTLLQKRQKWRAYKGKYIKWKGVVTYRGSMENGQERFGVSHKSGTNAELIFNGINEDLAKMIKKGKRITYTGKLGKLIGRNLLCNIENVEIQKVDGKPIGVLHLATASSVLPSITESENKIMKDFGVTMPESMAPENIKKDDLNFKETKKGFVEISFVELDKIFGLGNRMTESRKDKLWDEYRNKHVRWTGSVVYRGLGRVSGLRMGMKHKEGTDVELCFDTENKETVLQTKTGDIITYTGKLVNRRGYILPYRLEEGRIEKVEDVQLTAENN